MSILNNRPSGGGREDNVSLLDYVGDETIVLCRNEQWLTARIGEIAKEGMSASALIADEGDTQATSKVVDANLFTQRLKQLRRITFTEGETAPERGVKRLSPRAFTIRILTSSGSRSPTSSPRATASSS